MKPSNTGESKSRPVLLIIAIVAAALVGSTVLTMAKSSSSVINITVTNNSQRQIRHLYLAAGDPNNWGADQLNGSTIPSGATFVIANVACNEATIRVIAEDENGCFVYNNASCDANQTWEITNSTTPDCGG